MIEQFKEGDIVFTTGYRSWYSLESREKYDDFEAGSVFIITRIVYIGRRQNVKEARSVKTCKNYPFLGDPAITFKKL